MTSATPPVPAGSGIPDRPALEGLEATWSEAWEREGTHRFDRAAALAAGRSALFSIDSPPPTASGSLHIGHETPTSGKFTTEPIVNVPGGKAKLQSVKKPSNKEEAGTNKKSVEA